MGYDPLIKAFYYNDKETLILEWEGGLKLAGKLDTIFEEDNGLDDDDEQFEIYDIALFDVSKILTFPAPEYKVENEIVEALQKVDLTKGQGLLEISHYYDKPHKISLEDETVIWEDSEPR
ncbi:hypothetical protein [Priestia endophytica]|uniref:hypothetical protein n=1 Tax=Priestia endophytica TaxID=135735 RepID=UPI0022808395|nr:hypothetical protein [Priestia endophytica]MCY8232889.1 hypothetical protein [Priestia endophytica]